jgi:hypothetical protein
MFYLDSMGNLTLLNLIYLNFEKYLEDKCFYYFSLLNLKTESLTLKNPNLPEY